MHTYHSVVSLRRMLRLLLESVNVIFKRAGYSARLEEDGICNSIGVRFSKEFFLSIERLVQHQFLLAILLVLGTIRVRRTVWTNDNFLLGDRYEPGMVYC